MTTVSYTITFAIDEDFTSLLADTWEDGRRDHIRATLRKRLFRATNDVLAIPEWSNGSLGTGSRLSVVGIAISDGDWEGVPERDIAESEEDV